MQGLTLRVMGDREGTHIDIPLSPGDEGTAQTIGVMRELAHQFSRSVLVRAVAAAVRATAASHRRGSPVAAQVQREELAALFAWFKRRVRFCRDPKGLELVRRPDHQIANMRGGRTVEGDCDDASVLGAAILLALGMRPVYITIARDYGDFEHVYWGARLADGSLVAMDPQEFDRPGEEAQGVVRKRVWDV